MDRYRDRETDHHEAVDKARSTTKINIEVTLTSVEATLTNIKATLTSIEATLKSEAPGVLAVNVTRTSTFVVKLQGGEQKKSRRMATPNRPRRH